MTTEELVIINLAPNFSKIFPAKERQIADATKLKDKYIATCPTATFNSELTGTKKIPAQLKTKPMLKVVTKVQQAATT